MTAPGQSQLPRSRRAMAIGTTLLVAAIFTTGAMVAQRARREAHAEEVLILQGVRRVCKLATVELSLADYTKKTVPKTIDLPFTKQPEAYLFYSGVVAAGFDLCEDAASVEVEHASRKVTVTLPPARILSVDVLRFETINESSGFLNAIAPEDRNRWFGEARAALEKGALDQGALERAQTHARELFLSFVERRGYKLTLTVGGHAIQESDEVKR
jgi:hypothetical protein